MSIEDGFRINLEEGDHISLATLPDNGPAFAHLCLSGRSDMAMACLTIYELIALHAALGDYIAKCRPSPKGGEA
ncbi:hypothetical protein FF098_014975 [Parvularcula flava]|uniref:Uncharacterized protein n=1 Tax=Aquisalinus luteolus TaxID=1566827 RepID=A0A8J3A3P7_9PROT|nr:hypothetical protein [Aquisalinus luteolus]NHK29221.1 hypothetical protein [Aquisalinus luteolus]GGH99921.1 hypothetical protein GCM10011355_27000 [Aquisalinus luteolus]